MVVTSSSYHSILHQKAIGIHKHKNNIYLVEDASSLHSNLTKNHSIQLYVYHQWPWWSTDHCRNDKQTKVHKSETENVICLVIAFSNILNLEHLNQPHIEIISSILTKNCPNWSNIFWIIVITSSNSLSNENKFKGSFYDAANSCGRNIKGIRWPR